MANIWSDYYLQDCSGFFDWGTEDCEEGVEGPGPKEQIGGEGGEVNTNKQISP